MSAQRRRSADRRRRLLGQNFLVDQALIKAIVNAAEIQPGELVVDIGAGRGALTLPLARAGARVWAVETDPRWADQLRAAVAADHSIDVRVITADFQQLRLPSEPYRVVANPPFGATTELLRLLLDRPDRGPDRADLIVQREVAIKHAARPPRRLRTAAWAPWWEFTRGRAIPRTAFRPVPSVDAAVLTVARRAEPVLPEWLAPDLADILRPHWDSGQRR